MLEFIPETPKAIALWRSMPARTLRHYAVTCVERLITDRNGEYANVAQTFLTACRQFADGLIDREGLDRLRESYQKKDAVLLKRHPMLLATSHAVYHCGDPCPATAAVNATQVLGADKSMEKRLLTLHLAWEPLNLESEVPVGVQEIARAIYAGNTLMCDTLADMLVLRGWMAPAVKLLRNYPDVVRPGMVFLDRLCGIEELPARVFFCIRCDARVVTQLRRHL